MRYKSGYAHCSPIFIISDMFSIGHTQAYRIETNFVLKNHLYKIPTGLQKLTDIKTRFQYLSINLLNIIIRCIEFLKLQ